MNVVDIIYIGIGLVLAFGLGAFWSAEKALAYGIKLGAAGKKGAGGWSGVVAAILSGDKAQNAIGGAIDSFLGGLGGGKKR